MEKFISPEPLPTPYENELLTILIEECAEVIQRATKMQRFGVMEVQTGQPLTNRDRLSDEIGDLVALINCCVDEDLVSDYRVDKARNVKRLKLQKYMQKTK